MKTLKKLGRLASIKLLIAIFISTLAIPAQAQPNTKKQKIMIALLLDTSNSMDGLIDQAKSQLWTIVNELASAKQQDGKRPDIQIALYEYGNDRLQAKEGYIRMVTNLTTDLDLISEKLFALTTNGGQEYCGHVIQTSINQLDWSKSEADLKMIFIAGNEPFTQGNVPFSEACNLAKNKDIVVNTIFCGSYNDGISGSWKKGATLTGGSYMSIEQDRKTVYIETPYDKEIDKLNDALNKTYIYYGTQGLARKEMQTRQDVNAEHYGLANKVKRAVSKSSHAYYNAQWDLVDAYKDDAKVIEKVKDENLPKEMKGMSAEEKQAYIKKKQAERTEIQKQIQALNKKRLAYISSKQTKDDKENMLDQAMLTAIKAVAKTKKLVFEK
ncbi:MAG: vWA domain-containing protein [Flammeovirgaceae bacterium]